ncbi:MAG: UDP-N-acetylmuramoyl-L-alanyl-D-glutamate--2,6-diaminopimelate ligase [bacterium]
MKSFLKKIIPQNILNQYHKVLAILASYVYGRPSEKMIVIGITGTNGKSTTTILISKILEEAGYKVGATSTAIFKIADKEWLNDKKMTMLGRFQLQKMLSQMVSAGCQYVVIETSSQGVEQFRHLGINYDVVVFTNLTPEHIEAHGGFDNYKKAKLKLFQHLSEQKYKIINNKKIKKVIAVNGDDEYAKDFLNFKADEKIIFGINSRDNQLQAKNIEFNSNGVSFVVNNTNFDLKLFGKFNVYNSLSGMAVALSQEVSLDICKKALEKTDLVPGRMEFINVGQPFKILVDYAPEPEGLKQLYQTIKNHHILSTDGRIIHVLGSCGGGRDVGRQSIMGNLVAQNADFIVVTNEDPYDDEPMEIINRVASGAVSYGKQEGSNLWKIQDRREAIKYALNLAKKDDLVLLTGKGCEQAICIKNNCKIPWDERQVARELAQELISGDKFRIS